MKTKNFKISPFWFTEYENYKPHGKCIGWYGNDQKGFKGEYKNGKRHGKYIGWYKDGPEMWSSEFRNGYRIS